MEVWWRFIPRQKAEDVSIITRGEKIGAERRIFRRMVADFMLVFFTGSVAVVTVQKQCGCGFRLVRCSIGSMKIRFVRMIFRESFIFVISSIFLRIVL